PALTVSTETTYPASSLPSGEMGFRMSSVLPSRRGPFRVATTLPTTRARIIYFPPLALPIGSTSSRLGCGRGITCTAINSPTRRAAAAPASVAALTAATSPRTSAVTYPEPIFSQPTSETLAAFTMASDASIIATKPRVSIIPKASPIDPPTNRYLGNAARFQPLIDQGDEFLPRYIKPVLVFQIFGHHRTP